MIVIPNQNLYKSATADTKFIDAFGLADDVLLAGVKNISDLMVKPGNCDVIHNLCKTKIILLCYRND